VVDRFSIGLPGYSVGDLKILYDGRPLGALAKAAAEAVAARYDAIPRGALQGRGAGGIAVHNKRDRRVPLGGWPKRALDLVGASIALVLLAPLMLTVAVLVRIVLGGPVIFVHRRVGFDGAPFDCYKFRTMMKDADAVLHRHLSADADAAREWRETQKLRKDPRVGGLGHVLRKSSIDELPQLFNVLRGDMSLVGPRPVLPDELSRYGQYAPAYLEARPGLTGMWQANGRNAVGYRGRIARDRYYARHWSLALDLKLILKTFPALLNFRQTA
jgi:exopolysaccharide production protein ExoY